VKIAVLIPAYRPAAALLDLVRALVHMPAVIVVDDGSGPEFHRLFEQVAALPNVHLLRHGLNRGKGAALKTGIEFAQLNFQDLTGIVTADADGQHHPGDIERVARALDAQPGALVMGVRGFQGEVPRRSRVGNVLSRWVVRAVVGQKISDTQTGLRGIPAALLPQLTQLEANGYDFELEMLIAAHHHSIPLAEVPVRTIYEPGNPSSHFNPIVDSMKVYFVLLRFAWVSLGTAIIDNVVFSLAYRRSGHILTSQILGRAAAVAFNYWMVRRSVFYSRQRHLAVLPKYLMLMMASGAASYGGIRLLSAQLAMNPIVAKLLVESCLFFGNFAIQRLFIFNPRAGRQDRRGDRSVALLVLLIFAAVVAIEIYGFSTVKLFEPYTWWPSGVRRLIRYISLFTEIGVPLLLMAPWMFAGTAAALILAGSAISAPMGLLSAAFFLLSAWALGSKLLRGGGAAFAILLGSGVYMFLMTLTARLPIHYPAVWAVLLAIPILLDPRQAWRGIMSLIAGVRCAELRSAGERAAFALLVFIMGMHWLVALKPEMSADGIMVHLAVASNVAAHHRMTYEPARILWSVMPLGADWAYSITYLLGGEPAPRLLNFAMLVLLLVLLHDLLRRWVARDVAFLLLAAFAATPLVQLVTGSLLVENLLAAMLLATFSAWWRFAETGEKRFLYLAAALGGFSLGVKVGAFAFLALLLPFAIAEMRRQRVKLAAVALALGLFVAAAAPTYAIAWRKTGNPVFPFYNQRFPSPLLDHSVAIREARFRQPLTWQTPFDLTFHTTWFFEGLNGTFGFQYLLLMPLAIVAVWPVRKRPVAAATTVGLGAMTLVLLSEPNLRYLYPALPLLFVPFAALLGRLQCRRVLYGALLAFVVVCVVLDIHFLPASGWTHREFYSQLVFARGGRDRLIHEVEPNRDVVRHFVREHPGEPVLLLAGGDIADVTAEAYVPTWHQYSVWEKLQTARNRVDMMRLLTEWKVKYFVAATPPPGVAIEPPGLRDLVEHCKLVEYRNRDFYLARVDPQCQ
jgi:glycosyltransferase involved in cell wall biosynthesis